MLFRSVGARVHLTHIKPGEMPAVLGDLTERLPGLALHPLTAGDRLDWD